MASVLLPIVAAPAAAPARPARAAASGSHGDFNARLSEATGETTGGTPGPYVADASRSAAEPRSSASADAQRQRRGSYGEAGHQPRNHRESETPHLHDTAVNDGGQPRRAHALQGETTQGEEVVSETKRDVESEAVFPLTAGQCLALDPWVDAVQQAPPVQASNAVGAQQPSPVQIVVAAEAQHHAAVQAADLAAAQHTAPAQSADFVEPQHATPVHATDVARTQHTTLIQVSESAGTQHAAPAAAPARGRAHPVDAAGANVPGLSEAPHAGLAELSGLSEPQHAAAAEPSGPEGTGHERAVSRSTAAGTHQAATIAASGIRTSARQQATAMLNAALQAATAVVETSRGPATSVVPTPVVSQAAVVQNDVAASPADPIDVLQLEAAEEFPVATAADARHSHPDGRSSGRREPDANQYFGAPRAAASNTAFAGTLFPGQTAFAAALDGPSPVGASGLPTFSNAELSSLGPQLIRHLHMQVKAGGGDM